MFWKKAKYKSFEIKPISLIDCLEDENLLPFSLIEKKSNNAYENMMAEMREKSPINSTYIKYMDNCIKRCVYLVGKAIDPKVVNSMGDEEKQILFGLILDKSFKLFKKIIKIPKDTAITLHFMGKNYGKSPIEIIVKNEDYTELDAFMLNNYCLYCGTEFEIAQEKKRNKK